MFKAVKEHFYIDDIDLIEKELLEIEPQKVIEVHETKTTPQPPKIQKIEPKVKTSIVARPIFKNNYERYEWHMQNGCICQEDRKLYIPDVLFKTIPKH